MNNENNTNSTYSYYDSHSGTYSSYDVDSDGIVSNQTTSIINLDTGNGLSVTQKMLDEIAKYPSSALLEVLRQREMENAKQANFRWWEKYTEK